MNARMIATMVGKDFKLYFANRLFAIVTVVGLAAYVAMYYLLPATVDEILELGLYMRAMPPALEELLDGDEVEFYRAESEEALKQAVLDGDIPVGYAFPDDLLATIRSGRKAAVQLYLASDTPPEFREVYAVILDEFAFAISGQTLDHIETTDIVLGPDMAGAQIPPRERLLPLLAVIALMVECIGLASLIAAEVEAGTLRALLVTPLTMSGVFLSKGIFCPGSHPVGPDRRAGAPAAADSRGAALGGGHGGRHGVPGRLAGTRFDVGDGLGHAGDDHPDAAHLHDYCARPGFQLDPLDFGVLLERYRVPGDQLQRRLGEVTQNLLMLLVYAAAFMALGAALLKRRFQ